MLNIISRRAVWHYNRRVPRQYQNHDPRKIIRISLKTKCKKEAIKLAALESLKLEEYWNTLAESGQVYSHQDYINTVRRSSLLGFQFQHKTQLANGNLDDLVKRLLFVLDQQIQPKQAEAVLGVVEEPQIMLLDLLPRFWEFRKEVKLEKSEKKYKRWQNPRILAMNNFIAVVGNKPVQELVRQDLLDFKQWWIDQIQHKNMSVNTANKSMDFVKNIVETVCDNLKIKIDAEHIFKKLSFKKGRKQRLPFTTEHILKVLLNEEKLKGLSDHYRKIIQVFAETGIHVDEQINIRPENIFLDCEIPHVIIAPHGKERLKTEHRERTVPLVGFALDAFKAYPQGFSTIVKDVNSASTAIGKYLRENKMLPTKQHSLYSLRHSFQDRLTNADCPDRIQTDLMGHAFTGRIKYGVGASLEHNYTWLKKIQLKNVSHLSKTDF